MSKPKIIKLKNKAPTALMIEQVRDGVMNPFKTLQTLSEHLSNLGFELNEFGIKIEYPEGDTTTAQKNAWLQSQPKEHQQILYHYLASVEQEDILFKYLQVLYPVMHAAANGDEEALKSMQENLSAMAEAHQIVHEKMQAAQRAQTDD